MIVDPRIPPLDMNYNIIKRSDGDAAAYEREFKSRACLKILPFLVKRANLTPRSAIYDHGCGLGPIAFAASNYLDSNGAYFGFDIKSEAITFLQKAYTGYPHFKFKCEPLAVEEDYVALALPHHREAAQTSKKSLELHLTDFVNRPVDVVWNHSVFTHMWIDPIIDSLKQFKPMLGPNGLSINTWLILDDFAQYILKCGMADRPLPYKVNGAYTYSRENPLICVAYELETVRQIYDAAGYDILDIHYGSWAGRENNVTYIDIVVAKPR